jgi:2-amino-4-hydroxy-6-hydroxymethyldihydropteridine diphosphokinase
VTEQSVCVLMGSNIRPEENMNAALRSLSAVMRIENVSCVWETPAVGSQGPNFLNAAVLAVTHLELETLKDCVLRSLEADMGRVRQADKNAARTIDLDIVLYGGQVVDEHLWSYAHLAVPVAELAPEVEQPGSGLRLREVAQAFLERGAIRPRPDVFCGLG